jgi:anaerobic ribonucleoside-triphosphate reductase activating protein
VFTPAYDILVEHLFYTCNQDSWTNSIIEGRVAISEDNQSEEVHELNIAAIRGRTTVLGPGLRAGIWVQGCPLHCRGCVAPGWIPFVSAMRLTPDAILRRFHVEELDGITLSGGEPMLQAAGLAALARKARQQKDLSFICFTGYRYEQLLRNPPGPGVAELLAQLDVLIDGPYVEALNDSVGLRGSSNQRVIHLTDRLIDHNFESHKRTFTITIVDGELSFVGVPTPDVFSAIQRVSHVGKERMAEKNERF